MRFARADHNDGGGTFSQVTGTSISAALSNTDAVAWGDVDNEYRDGDLNAGSVPKRFPCRPHDCLSVFSRSRQWPPRFSCWESQPTKRAPSQRRQRRLHADPRRLMDDSGGASVLSTIGVSLSANNVDYKWLHESRRIRGLRWGRVRTRGFNPRHLPLRHLPCLCRPPRVAPSNPTLAASSTCSSVEGCTCSPTTMSCTATWA